MKHLNRRNALKLSASALANMAMPRVMSAATPTPTFSFSKKVVANVPLDFNGLSYESPQLANPRFFSPQNKELVAIFRELSPNGVLRTGGNLSAFTGWRDDPSLPITAAEQAVIDKGKKYWEWDLCDPMIAKGNHEAVFTPASIEALAGFLKATGWKLLYGLNFGTGTPEQAAAEAACVQRLVGNNLLAFQLGNEIDFWSGGMRPKPWDFDTFYTQWKEWVRVIRKTVPNAPMGGPDTAVRPDWMEQLAEREKSDIVILTKHHYAMGPAGDPRMNAAHLLGPDPDVAKEIASAKRAKAFAGVGFRTAECGSCFHGGQPGVSNAFASALWSADYMLTLAQGGHAGINMHGGGDGFYSPITGDSTRGFLRQPLFYGMKFAQQFAGAAILESSLTTSGENITAFAARAHDGLFVAFINKSDVSVTVDMPRTSFGKEALQKTWKLSAPAIDSRRDVTFAEADLSVAIDHGTKGDSIKLDPYSAVLLKYR